MARFQLSSLREFREVAHAPAHFTSAIAILAGIVYTPQYLDLFNRVIEAWYSAAPGIFITISSARDARVPGYAHLAGLRQAEHDG